MAWKEIHHQASPLIPQGTSTSSYTEQFRGVGNTVPESRTNHYDHFPYRHQQYFHPQHPRLYAPHQPLDMHEAIIQREMEKERIREEIIMTEIMRRRALEDEVRRELMMEREFALRRGVEGFPFGGPFSSTGGTVLGAGAEGWIKGRHEIGRFESLPFQRRGDDVRLSEVKPVLEARDSTAGPVLGTGAEGWIKGRHEIGRFESLPFQRRGADVRISEVQPVLEARDSTGGPVLGAGAEGWIKGRSEIGQFESLPFQRRGADVRISEVQPVLEARDSTGGPVLGAGAEGWINGRHEIGRIESLPFQRRGADVRISEVKPVLEGAKEKEKSIFPAKPVENISGLKRKAPTPPPPPPPEAAASEPPPESVSKKKKADKDLICALCQVSTTSEQGLSEHVKGKKHKTKEAAMRSGKKYTIGLLTKRSTKPVKILPETSEPCTEEKAVESMSEPLLSEKTNTAHNVENLNSKSETVVVEKVQKKEEGSAKKEKYKFWCELCQVGTHNLKIMNEHKNGKKHVKRSKQNGGLDQKGEIVISGDCEGNVARDGQEIASDNVDEEKGDEMMASKV